MIASLCTLVCLSFLWNVLNFISTICFSILKNCFILSQDVELGIHLH